MPAGNNNGMASPSSSSAPPPQQQYPTFQPDVLITGMATHPDADPRPVYIVDAPMAYQIRIKIPCRARGLNFLEYGRTEGKTGLHLEGIADVSEGRLERRFVRRRGMRRLYSAGDFSFTFLFPQRVKMAVLRGRCHGDGTVKFVVPKKPADEPDSDSDEADYEPQAVQWN